MKKLDKKKQMYITIVFIVALVIGVGYALLNSTLNITGNTKIKENSWDVHFENFAPKSGSVTATSAGINTGGTAVNYTVTLSKPGDFYEFEVDVVNKGSIDAMINTISNTGLTNAQKKYMTYSVAYSDGTEIAEKQKLEATTGKETIKVKVEYKKDITASDLPSTEQTISLTFSVNYVQADGSAIPVRDYVCRRATTLHGNNIYGSLGTTGTLAAGNAFDCDVNGDGTYNSETERFYYLTDLDTNSDYAVLIYYSNVAAGVPNNNTIVQYNANGNSGDPIVDIAPVTLRAQLPTTSQWSNVSLSSTTRNILDNNGNIKVNNFSYEGYAARPITYQEVVSVCGTGTPTATNYLNNCKYLLENTSSRGYWLETRYAESCTSMCYNGAWYTQSGSSYSNNLQFAGAHMTNYGARPAIEVPKTKISY